MRKKFNIFISILVIVTLLLEVINIHFSNKLAAESILVTKLQEDLRILQEKNIILKSEILEHTSFETISSRAATLGFAEAKGYISLFSPLEVAARHE